MPRLRCVSMWGIVLSWAATRCCLPALAEAPTPPALPSTTAGESAEPAPAPPPGQGSGGTAAAPPAVQATPATTVPVTTVIVPKVEPTPDVRSVPVQRPQGARTPNGPQQPTALEVVKERYPNKQIAIERHVTQDEKHNYINHGTWTMWDPEGRLLCQGDFFNGKAVGKWVRIFHQGGEDPYNGIDYEEFSRPFKAEATFADDRLTGAWTLVDNQGHTIHSWEFNDDKLNGRATAYYANGAVRTEAMFANGVLSGEASELDAQGNKITTTTWQAGRRIGPTTQRYPSGGKYSEGEYVFAREDKEVTYDFFKGTIKADKLATKAEDRRHGHWVWWYEDGEKMCEGDFVDGKPIGHHTWYHTNGQKEMEGDFVEGKRQGMWTTWYAGGQKKSEGVYDQGREAGQWFAWRDDGKVSSAVAYRAPRTMPSTDGQAVPSAIAGQQLAPGQYIIQGQPQPTIQRRPTTLGGAMQRSPR